MAYNWAQLAFVEKWRRHAVLGRLVGMHRPEDKTYFDLRLYPGEGNVGQLLGPADLHLLDAGDLVREKKMVLLDRVSVVLRVVAEPLCTASQASATLSTNRPRRWLECGSNLKGRVLAVEGDTLLIDAGLPMVVELASGENHLPYAPGQTVDLRIAETPKGFFVV